MQGAGDGTVVDVGHRWKTSAECGLGCDAMWLTEGTESMGLALMPELVVLGLSWRTARHCCPIPGIMAN